MTVATSVRELQGVRQYSHATHMCAHMHAHTYTHTHTPYYSSYNNHGATFVIL